MDAFFCTYKIRDTRVNIQSNKRYQSKYSKCFLRVELAQIDAQAKTMPVCPKKEAEKARKYCILTKD